MQYPQGPMQYPQDPKTLKTANAYDDIENTIENSDFIICNNIKYYNFYNKLKDDTMFLYNMQSFAPPEKNMHTENHLRTTNENSVCHHYRAHNMPPCNYASISCDKTQICTSPQLFMNLTKQICLSRVP